MPGWPSSQIPFTPSARLKLVWSRSAASSTSVAFIFLFVFMSLAQIALQLGTRQSVSQAQELLGLITDVGLIPETYNVLMNGQKLLACFDIPPLGTSFDDFCDTIWSESSALADPNAFAGTDTTVAFGQASTILYDVAAQLQTARPLATLLVFGYRNKKRPKRPMDAHGRLHRPDHSIPLVPSTPFHFPIPTADVVVSETLVARGIAMSRTVDASVIITAPPTTPSSLVGPAVAGPSSSMTAVQSNDRSQILPHLHGDTHDPLSITAEAIRRDTTSLKTLPGGSANILKSRRTRRGAVPFAHHTKRTVTYQVGNRIIMLDAQFDTPESTTSDPMFRSLSNMTISGLNPAPPGSVNILFVRAECVRSLSWVEQELRNVWKESIVGIAWWAWLAVINLSVIWGESVSLTITAFIGACTSVVGQSLQLFQTRQFSDEFNRVVVNGACGGVNVLESYPDWRMMLQIPGVISSVVGLFISAAFTWNLVRRYGSDNWAKVNANPVVKRPYCFLITLSVLLELSTFFMPATGGLWLDQIFEGLPAGYSDDQQFEGTLFSSFNGFILPWLLLGWLSVRKGLCRTMIIFLIVTIPFIVGWALIFAIDIYRVLLEIWVFFAVFPIISVLLATAILGFGIVFRYDFKRDLFVYMQSFDDPSQSDVEAANAFSPQKVPKARVGAIRHSVRFYPTLDISRKQSYTADGERDRQRVSTESSQDVWTRQPLWTPTRLRNMFLKPNTSRRSSRAPSRSSSFYDTPISDMNSGTTPPSTMLASLRNMPSSPHYTDSSADLSEGGTWRVPREGDNGGDPTDVQKREERISMFSADSSGAEGLRRVPSAVLAPARPPLGTLATIEEGSLDRPKGLEKIVQLRNAGKFALGLK
ncbi:hypothetical protein FRB99_001001 [Tulasnella sp. 403]|nr:hypothetical protein FRB99_001001 [Tulasnella sp. 403]